MLTTLLFRGGSDSAGPFAPSAYRRIRSQQGWFELDKFVDHIIEIDDDDDDLLLM